MEPAIVPGFGMGVTLGSRVIVIVGVSVIAGSAVGEKTIDGVFVGATRVGEDNGVGCSAGCVIADNVRTTLVETILIPVPVGAAAFGKLQPHKKEIKKNMPNIARFFFMGQPF